MKLWKLSRLCCVYVSLAAAVAGCFANGVPNKAQPSNTAGTAGTVDDIPSEGGADGGAGAAPLTPIVCTPAKADALPARAEAMSSDAQAAPKPIFTYDLFASFNSYCGGCHVQASVGGFGGKKITLQNFAKLVDQKAIDRLTSNDPTKVMPPLGSDAGKLWDERAGDDGIRLLEGLLEKWIAAGRPDSVFYDKPVKASGVSQYLLTQDLGKSLTNLGNCIPDRIEAETDSSKTLDAFFAKATELPVTLEETDLTSFDSAVLARSGVIGFAPAYPLWADDAKKIRYVRVPRGQSIKFDAKTQKFDIPANTRFYKTFLKKVTDTDGNQTYRKIETRLIVSRPDKCTTDVSGQHCQILALMGTYAWNAEETKAELVRDPLRNGKPFTDRLITYVTDEKKAKGVDDPQAAGLTRHYAIPGSTRCQQCHMGSVSQSGILGFLPLQIRRRPKGEGGVIEDTGEDELDQLDRLIQYGVITGIKSESEIAKLEESQAQPPRNDYELTAQGYMLGNCGHCHNPRGYPSIKNPELSSVLQFFPNMQGGIFQFPLDKVSPRLHRGRAADIDIPYITPSLIDMPAVDPAIPGFGTVYTEKETFVRDADGHSRGVPLLAPWRSLIYRNVDTPFSYADDFAIFPHMPLNTPGYDCRAPHIMADWMLSIPARLVKEGAEDDSPSKVDLIGNRLAIIPQPFIEVKSDNVYFEALVKVGQKRVEDYHASERYNSCPDTSDIVDPKVVAGQAIVPGDDGYPIPDFPSILIKDGVPDRAHWAVTDQTDVAGDWLPRRPDYADVLLNGNAARVAELDEDRRSVIHIIGLADKPELKPLLLASNFKDFALHQFPMAPWLVKSGCDQALSGEHPASYFRDAGQDPTAALDSMSWLQGDDAPPAQAPVYTQAPGAMVFGQICRNCHGPNADGLSTLADTISAMTGGQTRVANLRDGLLGIGAKGEPNRDRVFGDPANALGIQPDDLAVRYLTWMALGGTEKPIPIAALVAVANTKVYGESREYNAAVFPQPPLASGNMLAAARWLCRNWVKGNVGFNIAEGDIDIDILKGMPFRRDNGDAEIWRQLCYWDNPGPVRALYSEPGGDTGFKDAGVLLQRSLHNRALYPRSAYPAGIPVGTFGGKVVSGLDDANAAPWCIARPPTEAAEDLAKQYWQQHAKDPSQPLPFCPPELLASDPFYEDETIRPDARNWAIRGAANAGAAVFIYLDAIAKGLKPRVDYDQCDRLAGSGM